MDIYQAYFHIAERNRQKEIQEFVRAERAREAMDAEKREKGAVTNGYYSRDEITAFTHVRNALYAVGRRAGFDAMAVNYMQRPIERTVDFLERGGMPLEKGKNAVAPVKSAENIKRARQIAGIFREMIKDKTIYEALVVFERKTDEKVRSMTDGDRFDADRASRRKRMEIVKKKERKKASESVRIQGIFLKKQAEVG